MATLDYNSGLSITEYFRNYIFDCFTRKPSDKEKKKCCSHTDGTTTDQRGRSYASVPGNGWAAGW